MILQFLALMFTFISGPVKELPKQKGLWISQEEIMQLPMEGEAWEALLQKASKPIAIPNLSNKNDNTNVSVLAKALVFARTGKENYRSEVTTACLSAVGTEDGGRTLALGRELLAYVIAADLVTLPEETDLFFRRWLKKVVNKELDGLTLKTTHERRPNNWGTHAGASRIAVALYLGDEEDLAKAAAIFKGFLGDRDSYAGFKYGDLSWQSNREAPVGINPKGASFGPYSLDGVLPDDQRRSGGFHWPAPRENYVYEALQGVLCQANLLYRAGYNTWEWEDKAILRAYQWLHEIALYPADGDDTWQPHLVNFHYGSKFPAPTPCKPGKNMGFTDWTHSVQ